MEIKLEGINTVNPTDCNSKTNNTWQLQVRKVNKIIFNLIYLLIIFKLVSLKHLTSPAGPLASPTGRPQSYSYSSTSSQRSWCALSSRLPGPVDMHHNQNETQSTSLKAPNYFFKEGMLQWHWPSLQVCSGLHVSRGVSCCYWSCPAGNCWSLKQKQNQKKKKIQPTWSKHLLCRDYRNNNNYIITLCTFLNKYDPNNNTFVSILLNT